MYRVYLNYVLYVLKQLHFFLNQHCLVAFFRLFGVCVFEKSGRNLKGNNSALNERETFKSKDQDLKALFSVVFLIRHI